MQIKKIHISNFGKLHEMQMDFSEGLNVINGRKWLGQIYPGCISESYALWNGCHHEAVFAGK